MSMWDDLSSSFIKVFTNPGKANFGDFATVTGSLVGAVAAGAGGVALLGGAGATAAPAGSAGVLGASSATLAGGTAGQSALLLGSSQAALAAEFGTVSAASNAAAAASIAGLGTSTVSGGILAGSTLSTAGAVAADFGAPAAAGSGFWAGLGSSIASAGKATGSFITKAALVSTAAKGIMSPWERAYNQVKDAVSGGGSTGTSVNVSSGGGLPGQPAGAQPVQASMSNVLMIGLFVSVVGSLIYTAFKDKK